jgi:hypothetical protein
MLLPNTVSRISPVAFLSQALNSTRLGDKTVPRVCTAPADCSFPAPFSQSALGKLRLVCVARRMCMPLPEPHLLVARAEASQARLARITKCSREAQVSTSHRLNVGHLGLPSHTEVRGGNESTYLSAEV